MKKSTFIGNLVAWIVVAALCCAFLAWWHLGNGTPNISDPLVQLGVVLASPLLLYAIGVLLGVALMWFKRILVGRLTKRVCRALGILGLVFLLLAGVPALVPATGGGAAGAGLRRGLHHDAGAADDRDHRLFVCRRLCRRGYEQARPLCQVPPGRPLRGLAIQRGRRCRSRCAPPRAPGPSLRRPALWGLGIAALVAGGV